MDGNEQAYPGQWYDIDSTGERVIRESFLGMTKREAMAMHLMAGLLSNQAMIDTYAGSALASTADGAVIAADALIAALNK